MVFFFEDWDYFGFFLFVGKGVGEDGIINNVSKWVKYDGEVVFE